MENNGGSVPNTGAPAAAAVEVPVVEVREQDRLMLLANVNRIMRRVLLPHAQISDDAKELVQECASEFISFVTGEANERCHDECRKTISVHDILWALGNLGFHDYVQPVAAYVHRMHLVENGVVALNVNPPLAGAGPRAPAAAFVPAAGAGSSQALMQQMQMQMQRGAMYYAPRPAAPVQEGYYGVPMPMRVRPLFVGGQLQGAVVRGDQPMTRTTVGNTQRTGKEAAAAPATLATREARPTSTDRVTAALPRKNHQSPSNRLK